MKRLMVLVAVLIGVLAGGVVVGGCGSGGSPVTGSKLTLPAPGKLYASCYPGGKTGEEDDITIKDVDTYQTYVGQQVAWVYFSNNWYRSRAFPTATCTWIRRLGSVPFVRLMLRSSPNEVAGTSLRHARKPGEGPWPASVEPVFTLPAIIAGKFDPDLRAWAQEARAFGTPVIVEWGTECNGDWFQWNGKYWGGGTLVGTPPKPEGPQRFVEAYRHIVTVMRAAGATNLTWAWHVNWDDEPDVAWNHFENYYPGSDVVDWLGVSCYGYLTPMDNYPPEALRMQMDSAYPRLAKLAAGKPIMLLEFGATAGNPRTAPQDWAQAALDNIFSARWPRLRGFSWWNERWENDNNPAHDTTMRVQNIPALAAVFKTTLAAHRDQIQTRPVYSH